MGDMGFWSEDCSSRAVALPHAHWAQCDPGEGGHPGTGEIHRWVQCCHCGLTPSQSHAEQDLALREAAVQPDLRSLALEAPECDSFRHGVRMALTPKIGDDGLEWPSCPDCGVQQEPKLATGGPIGPFYGKGRGWVSPRMQRRWEFISARMRGLH